jgi:uncharacterized DUF497 family protein
MTVEWNSAKAIRNLEQHGASFVEAVGVFSDPLALMFADPSYSISENRFLTFGVAATGRFLVIAHMDRGDHIRLVSARLMTSRERRQYEQHR